MPMYGKNQWGVNGNHPWMGKCVSKAVENAEEVFPKQPSKGHGDLVDSVAQTIKAARVPTPPDPPSASNPNATRIVEGRATPPEIAKSGSTSNADLASGQPVPSSSALMITSNARQACRFVTVPTQVEAISAPDHSPTTQRPVLALGIKDSPSGDVSESVSSSGHGSDSIIAHNQISPTVSGTVIPLRVIAKLGSGLDARVYSARRIDAEVASNNLDTYLTQSKEVAVKVTRLVPKSSSNLPRSSSVLPKKHPAEFVHTGTVDSHHRAYDEQRILQKLSGHPNVIKLYNTFESDNHVYQVVERCVGDLVDVARSIKKHIPESVLARWAYQIVSAIAYAHHRDVVHGDLKPDNILIRKDGSIAVSDWGFARDSANAHSPHCKEFHGTDHYAPPEWLLGERGKSKEADVWGVGAVIYSVAYAKLPFGHVNREDPETVSRVCTEPLFFYSDVRQASLELKLFVSSMMSKKWRDRKPMQEFLRHAWLANEAEISVGLDDIASSMCRPSLRESLAEQEGEQ